MESVDIATSGRAETARPALKLLGAATDTPMITRDMVGDSVWDLLAARRAQSIGIGLMSGGYGREEPERAGVPGAGRVLATSAGSQPASEINPAVV
jgi:phosphoglycolate phosphatase-like HAD superfamily hydrolase